VYAIIVGAGKVGRNLARELIDKEHEVTLLESSRPRYLLIEEEFEHSVQYGDATELWVLERAGIQRADLVIAVTGDDEDNMLVCQVAKEKYLCDRIIARVNNPRNHDHFRLLGIEVNRWATHLPLSRSIQPRHSSSNGSETRSPTAKDWIFPSFSCISMVCF